MVKILAVIASLVTGIILAECGYLYATDAPASMAQHPDALLWAITILIGIVAFFSVRTLNKIDRNQGVFFRKFEELDRRVTQIETAHNINHGQSLGR
jgi:hypothetical protein